MRYYLTVFSFLLPDYLVEIYFTELALSDYVGHSWFIIKVVVTWSWAYGDGMAWNHFPHPCTFVREMHWSLVYLPHKVPVMWSFDILYVNLLVWIRFGKKRRVAGDLRWHDTDVKSLKYSSQWTIDLVTFLTGDQWKLIIFKCLL